ncbi:hypothetical protein [Zavarzinella formosa]|uniref:hypothetical protein n=1 Tax=Zavarzinella formosa TaxID=360055 RepID=UPI0002EB1837|nr:hypothetical protein [Zavarzinella formosa]
MIWRIQTIIAMAIILMAATIGCDDSGKGMVQVEGAVSFDDAPLPEGDIIFIPSDKQFGAEAGKIKDGKYSFKARTGASKVEIRASREVPGKKGPMGEPLIEPYVPAAYNSKSTLTADVSPAKKTFDFALKSKP